MTPCVLFGVSFPASAARMRGQSSGHPALVKGACGRCVLVRLRGGAGRMHACSV